MSPGPGYGEARSLMWVEKRSKREASVSVSLRKGRSQGGKITLKSESKDQS